MKKTIFSLALGTFGLGMAEFGIMGVLTELAHDTGISIPSAGNMISFYAFGVVIGAPIAYDAAPGAEALTRLCEDWIEAQQAEIQGAGPFALQPPQVPTPVISRS